MPDLSTLEETEVSQSQEEKKMSDGFYLRITQEHGPIGPDGNEQKSTSWFFDTREGSDYRDHWRVNEKIAEEIEKYGPPVKVEIETVPVLYEMREGSGPKLTSHTDEYGITHVTISAIQVEEE